MKQIIQITFILLLFSCSQKGELPEQVTEINIPREEKQRKDSEFFGNKNDCIDSILSTFNLIDIQSIDSTIQIDLKYASTDNFTKQQLYYTLNKIYLQKNVAERLAKCQQYLKSLYPDYNLLIYDGVRPVSVQQRMWDALDTISVPEREKFVSNPKNHSVHNYGAAVDLTIIDKTNTPLDMGAGYDDIRKIAYPSMEEHFLKTGELTPHQVENRKLLRKVMKHQGFINIPSEWWHFNAYRRNEVKRKYPVIKEEPKCE